MAKIRTKAKQDAQETLMQAMITPIEYAGDYGYTAEQVEEMRIQARRVAKLFGYTSYPGLGDI